MISRLAITLTATRNDLSESWDIHWNEVGRNIGILYDPRQLRSRLSLGVIGILVGKELG